MPVCGARSPAPVCSPNAFYRPTPLRIRTQRSFAATSCATVSRRDALAAAGKLDDPLFADAWQFARADRIVLAAPFWELSFPAILKIYLERVSMRDITFGYEESGLVGRCRAEKLLLVTTRGGDYSLPETEWMEMGARQLKALCAMFGIPKFELLCAEGLDDERVDAHSRMDEALARADALGKTF